MLPSICVQLGPVSSRITCAEPAIMLAMLPCPANGSHNDTSRGMCGVLAARESQGGGALAIKVTMVAAPSGHELLVDVSRGQLFCSACDDYVYSAEFDAAIAVSAP